MPFKKLLIANRGEIALRITRTAHKMSIPVVAVTTEAERNAQHARLADEVVVIGEGPVGDSYLNAERLVDAALKTGAEAIHPGYGFLSQSPEFVRLVEQNGIKFVGPSEDAMRKMGSKSEAKKIMEKAGVPIIRGYHDDNQDPDHLYRMAHEVGFPVMIKAVMGGGGKGMRMAPSADEFYTQLQSAKNEAKNAFGNDAMIIEKFVVDPKHIEVQILADEHGNTFHLFERDCSVQRLNQKVFEEAPSNVDPATVAQIRAMGVRAAQSVNYSNAGTVEFLYEKRTGKFYFMEMNTRLQVEHPVSEMVTGLDIVELQLRVAQGENLAGLKVPEKPLGHAIEARINAEDPHNNFMPSIGKVHTFAFQGHTIKDSSRTMNFDMKDNWSPVRLDTYLVEGAEVVRFYDSMVAKLIVFGKDRPEALQRLQKSLASLEIGGVQTNLAFLNAILREPKFRAYDYSLDYFPQNKARLLDEAHVDAPRRLLWIAAARLFPGDFSPDRPGHWNFRNNSLLRKMMRFSVGKSYALNSEPQNYLVRITQKELGKYRYEMEVSLEEQASQTWEVDVLSREGSTITLQVDGVVQSIPITQIGDSDAFIVDGTYYTVNDRSLESVIKSQADQASNSVRSPMPGTVMAVNVKEGDSIKKGGALGSVEAMKMEHKLLAKFDLKVTKVYNKVKDFVDKGAVLFEVQPI